MNHSITTRSLASSEQRLLQGSKTSLLNIILLPIIPGGGALIAGIFGYAGLLWLLEKVGINVSESIRLYGFVGVAILAFLVGAGAALSFFRALKKSRQREKTALDQATVEMIAVEDPVVVQQEEYNDEGPIYYFGIGKGKVLFVCGQWLYEDQVYEPVPSTDTDDENWPPFPCESFILHRIPESGSVLKIEIKGRKVAPARTIKRKEVTWDEFYCSLLLDGDLDNLQEAMARATGKTKRRTKRTMQVR